MRNGGYKILLMAKYKTVVNPLHMHRSYCSFVLGLQYDNDKNFILIVYQETVPGTPKYSFYWLQSQGKS